MGPQLVNWCLTSQSCSGSQMLDQARKARFVEPLRIAFLNDICKNLDLKGIKRERYTSSQLNV